MKKISLLLCCILLLQLLCACSASKEEFKNPVNFYYCRRDMIYNSPHAVIQPEMREGYGYHGNIVGFLQAYLRGPLSEDLEALIPSEIYLVSCTINGDVADIVFSSQFSKLSGIRLTMACSAVLLSVNEFSNVESVRIYAKDAQLDEQEYFELSMSDIVLLDTIGL